LFFVFCIILLNLRFFNLSFNHFFAYFLFFFNDKFLFFYKITSNLKLFISYIFIKQTYIYGSIFLWIK